MSDKRITRYTEAQLKFLDSIEPKPLTPEDVAVLKQDAINGDLDEMLALCLTIDQAWQERDQLKAELVATEAVIAQKQPESRQLKIDNEQLKQERYRLGQTCLTNSAEIHELEQERDQLKATEKATNETIERLAAENDQLNKYIKHNRITEYVKENMRLKAELEQQQQSHGKTAVQSYERLEKIRALEQQVEVLREGLEFYGDPAKYMDNMGDMQEPTPSDIEKDEGQKARDALARAGDFASKQRQIR